MQRTHHHRYVHLSLSFPSFHHSSTHCACAIGQDCGCHNCWSGEDRQGIEAVRIIGTGVRRCVEQDLLDTDTDYFSLSLHNIFTKYSLLSPCAYIHDTLAPIPLGKRYKETITLHVCSLRQSRTHDSWGKVVTLLLPLLSLTLDSLLFLSRSIVSP